MLHLQRTLHPAKVGFSTALVLCCNFGALSICGESCSVLSDKIISTQKLSWCKISYAHEYQGVLQPISFWFQWFPSFVLAQTHRAQKNQAKLRYFWGCGQNAEERKEKYQSDSKQCLKLLIMAMETQVGPNGVHGGVRGLRLFIP